MNTVIQTAKMVVLVILLLVALYLLAGCSTTQVTTCAPVPDALFVLPPSAAREVLEGDTEADYLDKVVNGLLADIDVRDARLRVIKAHQAPCK